MKRHVLVTGASKGIGKAIAITLSQDFKVAVHYCNDKEGALNTIEHITKLGNESYLLNFDVCDKTACEEKLNLAINTHGPFYGIVLNAGINADDAFVAMDYDNWFKVINTDLLSLHNVLTPCLMPMISARCGGRIVALSSVSGVIGNRGQVNYAAAKAGIIGACKSLAIELAKRKITVNTIAPGLIETDMIQLNDIALTEALKLIPLKRMGKAQEVADLCAFLMSDKASYITRQVIGINGGMI